MTAAWTALPLLALSFVVVASPSAPESANAQGQSTLELVGLTVASHMAAVAAEQPGTIVEMPASDGVRVKQGDPLVVLSHRLQQLEVARLRALVESDHEMSRAMANLEHARDKAQRMRELSQQQISAPAALQEVELESRIAQLLLGKAEFEREQTRNELAQAEERLSQRTLRSPLDGVVTRRLKQVGETTEELAPVIEVMSLDPLWIEFECPVTQEQRFPVGGHVRIRTAVGDSAPRVGAITHVSLKATPASHSFLVRASIANEDYSWRAGLKVWVEPAQAPAAAPPGGK